jgi:hypothetical protein
VPTSGISCSDSTLTAVSRRLSPSYRPLGFSLRWFDRDVISRAVSVFLRSWLRLPFLGYSCLVCGDSETVSEAPSSLYHNLRRLKTFHCLVNIKYFSPS